MKRKLMMLAAFAIMAINFSSCVVHERSYAYRDRGYHHHHGWRHHHDHRAGATVIVR
jgi:hypothetical protein